MKDAIDCSFLINNNADYWIPGEQEVLAPIWHTSIPTYFIGFLHKKVRIIIKLCRNLKN